MIGRSSIGRSIGVGDGRRCNTRSSGDGGHSGGGVVIVVRNRRVVGRAQKIVDSLLAGRHDGGGGVGVLNIGSFGQAVGGRRRTADPVQGHSRGRGGTARPADPRPRYRTEGIAVMLKCLRRSRPKCAAYLRARGQAR